MRIGIYQSYWGWLGGGGVVIGTAAEALARHHEVEVVHHNPLFEVSAYEEALALDLSRVRFRHVAQPARPAPRGWNPVERFLHEKHLGADLSRPYDLFINSCETVPLFCHADRGVLFTWFPFVDAPAFHGRSTPAWRRRAAWLRGLLRLHHELEWRLRFRTYQRCITCSEYSRQWVRRSWGIDAEVVYPPVRVSFQPRRKEELILSVGRFQANRTGHFKNHQVLIEAFRRMHDEGLRGWRYVLAGGVRNRAEDAAYLASLRNMTEGYPIEIRENLPGAELRSLYESAALFWHGTGYGADAETQAAQMEHFGIATVEAMAAGCVPVTFRGGGQLEIIREGRDGFFWQTPDELIARTRELIETPERRTLLAAAAVERSRAFSRQTFVDQLFSALRSFL